MKLQDITERGLIVELYSERRSDGLRERVENLGRWRPILIPNCLWEVLRRHDLTPSGVQGGIAFPSARIPDLAKPVLVIERSKQGLDAQAPDRTIVHVIMMRLDRRNPPAEERAFFDRPAAFLRTEKAAALLAQVGNLDQLGQALQLIDSISWGASESASSPGGPMTRSN